MKKTLIGLVFTTISVFFLNGCSSVGAKTESLLGVYIATAVISLLLLIAYFCLVKKRNLWFILLFLSVFVVNIGYLSLAISSTLEEALLANRISYLGSVFLPLSMLMIIINNKKLRYPKALPYILVGVSIIVFIIAATPGYLDIYYKDVSLVSLNGVSSLDKVYGPWHFSYLLFLMSYFGVMIFIIVRSIVKNKTESITHSVILTFAVGVNIGVWLLQQFVKFDFELLTISYIITETFLLGLNLLLQDEEKKQVTSDTVQITEEAATTEVAVSEGTNEAFAEQLQMFINGISTLTATERIIFDLYIEGNGTKDVLAKLNIKENTLKYHNKNIYGKLAVSSRKQLLSLAASAGNGICK